MMSALALLCVAGVSQAFNSPFHVPESPARQKERLEAYGALVEQLTYNPTPAPNNPDLDCKLRRVAYDFGLDIMPARAPLQSLWDALELTTRCNQTGPPHGIQGAILEGKAASIAALPQAIDRQHYGDEPTFYVDPVHGSDSGSGTESSPFKTIERGVEASRAPASSTRTIVLRGGLYTLTGTIALTEQDSGLTFQAYQDEEPVVSGAMPLNDLNWEPYNVTKNGSSTMDITMNSNDIYGQISYPKENTSNIHYLGQFDSYEPCAGLCEGWKECTGFTWQGESGDEWAHGCYGRTDGKWTPVHEDNIVSGYKTTPANVWRAKISSDQAAKLSPYTYGVLHGSPSSASQSTSRGGSGGSSGLEWSRTIRARWPNVRNPETDFFPAGWASGKITWGPIRSDYTSYDPVFVDSPNDTWSGMFNNFQGAFGGHCHIFKPNFSYWCGEHTKGGGGVPFKQPWGVTWDPKDDVFPEALKKADLQDRLGFHTWREAHWATWSFIIDDADFENGRMNWTVGGFQGARGADEGAEYWIDNALVLLDNPNEFFIEFPSGKPSDGAYLYYFPNNTEFKPPSADEVFAPTVLNSLFTITGSSQASAARDVAFRGIKFIGAASTYLEDHIVPSGGDWSLELIGALLAENTEGLTIDGCLFERCDGNAVFLNGYNKDSFITNNEFAWIGSTAIALNGQARDDLMDLTDGDQPTNVFIRGNLIREIGVGPPKQESCVFESKTSNTTFVENLCFNGPRAGYNANDKGGTFGSQIHRNFLGNMCRESSDHAVFNSWSRQVYLFKDQDGVGSTVHPTPTDLSYNFYMGNYGAVNCVDNDDGSALYNIHDSVAYGGGHKSDFGGYDKKTYNELQIYARVYAPQCFSVSTTGGPDHPEGYYNNTCIIDPSVQTPTVYNLQYSIDPTNATNNDFRTNGNAIVADGGADGAKVKIGSKTVSFSDWLAMGLDDGTTITSKQPSNDEIEAMARAKLGL